MNEKATIMFVDDEERILRSLRMMFKSQYNVKTTTDGNEALDIIKRDKVHVIVSDQRMPLMQGVDLLRAVKDASPNTMRLLLTGYSDLSAVIGSINEGEIFRYISKPWNPDDIRSTIEKAAQIAMSLEALPNDGKAANDQSHGTTENILIIDEDPATATTVKEVINREIGPRHTVEWGSSLDAAFEILAREPIAVVVSDVRIGGEDISGALKTLKQHHPDILTIVLTSFKDTSTLVDLINQGQVYRFLPKPVSKGLLVKSIQASINRYRLLQDRPQLVKRHVVEPSKRESDAKISSRIMNYMKKFRGRQQPGHVSPS